jgi:ankyrin repeat protein
VRALLHAGADVHARERASSTTALHWAAEAGHPDIVEALLARDAEKEALDRWFHLAPLGWALAVDWAPDFREDKAAAAAILQGAGATIDPFSALLLGRQAALAADPTAVTRRLGPVGKEMHALHFAVTRNLLDPAVWLLDLGARHDEVTSFGLTPLALAHETGHLPLGELLRARGADEDLSCAVVTGDLDETRRLTPVTHNKLRGLLLYTAAARGDADVLAVLLDHGAEADTGIPYLVGEARCQVSALHAAAKHGHLAVARILLHGGANPSFGAAESKPTPLHVAAQHGHTHMVRLLLDAGADPAAREEGFGATPGGWAAHEGHAELARLLGVDVSATPAE